MARGVFVDDDMYEILNQYTWRVSRGGYAYTIATKSWANPTISAMMHHCVIGRSLYPLVTDHINRIKLDNRRENLRHITQQANRLNSKQFDGKGRKPSHPSDLEFADRSQTYQSYAYQSLYD
jgi:hypothetical protein